MTLKLALIGFGTVAQGLAKLLLNKPDILLRTHNADFCVTSIATNSKGSVFNPNGLDLAQALSAIESGSLENYSGGTHGLSAKDLIENENTDVVVENTLTNLEDGGAAMDHFKTALNCGKHVVTANKGPIVLAYRQLMDLAAANNVHLLFEGTVLSGTPILSLHRAGLGGSTITGLKGILNGTTNYILTQMETGMRYADALKQAQDLGFAEADPAADVDGWDALAKIIILANVLMGADLKVPDVKLEGISGISTEDVTQATANGQRWKLIGQASVQHGNVIASVKPTLVDLSDPLAGVGAAMNALTFETDVLKSVTITGAGAGGPQTGFAVLSDLLELTRRVR